MSVTVDGTPAPSVALKQPHRKIVAQVGPGSGLANVRVEVAGQSHDVDILRAPPEVTSVEPPDADPAAGGRLVLHGANFGCEAARVEVLLADFPGLCATRVHMLPGREHSCIECTVPPMPPGCTVGSDVNLRLVVDGVYASTMASFRYCPPFGLPATPGRPAYMPLWPRVGHGGGLPFSLQPHSLSAEGLNEGGANGGAAASGGGSFPPALGKATVASTNELMSPYSDLFSIILATDAPKPATTGSGEALEANSASSSAAGAASNASAVLRRAMSVRVGGTLMGGPTLSVTPPRKWAPDSPACEGCAKEFSLTRRRHHCRIWCVRAGAQELPPSL